MSSPDARDDVAKVNDLAKDIKFAMLTTVDADGEFVSRPMVQQSVEFDGDLWFFAERDSRKTRQIAADPHVGVTLTSSDAWVSINGSAEVVTDVAKARELWNAGIEAWLPQGPESPEVVLIKVSGETAEYWDNPAGRVATAFSFVKAKVTGERLEGTENETVQL